MPKRLNLVTGGAGFTGSYVIRELLKGMDKLTTVNFGQRLFGKAGKPWVIGCQSLSKAAFGRFRGNSDFPERPSGALPNGQRRIVVQNSF